MNKFGQMKKFCVLTELLMRFVLVPCKIGKRSDDSGVCAVSSSKAGGPDFVAEKNVYRTLRIGRPKLSGSNQHHLQDA